MPKRRSRKSLAAQAIDLGFAVPQVIAHRTARMAAAGARPSARDRREFHRMGTEKILAFNEAWSAMAMQAFVENQKLALSFWFPWAPAKSVSKQMNTAALNILGKGVAPIRRRAVANAKRLGRAKRR